MGTPEHGIPPPAERIRLRQRIQHRPSLRQRIKRRARVLAFLDRERYVDAMIAELYLGRLDENDIDAWEPVRGTSPILERLHEILEQRLRDRKET